MLIDRVRNLTPEQMRPLAMRTLDDGTEIPHFIVGFLIDNGGGMIFETVEGVDGGATIRYFTEAEIWSAAYRNFWMIGEIPVQYLNDGGAGINYSSIPKGGSNKFCLPYQIARGLGVI